MRIVYSLVLVLLFPVFVWSAIKRYRRSGDIQVLKQPFSIDVPQGPFDVWIHAVSVGESRAVFPLLEKWQRLNPNIRILMTTTTPTGAEQVRHHSPVQVTHCYLPFDYPWFLKRFLTITQPKQAVIVETELWPNLFATCSSKSIPVSVINARLSEKSARNYEKLSGLFRPLLESAQTIFTRDELDTQRFLRIAPNANVETLGNIKDDLEIPKALPAKVKVMQVQIGNRPVWLAASTHEGEEALLIEAHCRVLQEQPNTLLILAPRHPDRAQSVFDLAEEQDLTVVRRSTQSNPDQLSQAQLLLVDVLGELLLWYGVSPIAFVGGSWVPVGGHNFLEAVAMDCAVISGPHLHNFEAIAEHYQSASAIRIVQNPTELSKVLLSPTEVIQTQTQRAREIWAQRKPVVDTLLQKLTAPSIS